MARIPVITSREALREEDRPIFDAIVADHGRLGAPYRLLLNNPDLARRAADVGSYILKTANLTPVRREIAILVAAREADCCQIWAAHVGEGRRAGVRDQVIDVVGRREPLDQLVAEEAVIVAYGRELLQGHRVSDETFAAAQALLGQDGVIDLTATLGFYTMAAGILNAFAFEPPPGAPELPSA